MTNLTHLLATALLLLASFIVGAVVGTLFRKLVSALTRSRPKPAAVPPAPPAEPMAEQMSPPLFEAPVVPEHEDSVAPVSGAAEPDTVVSAAPAAEPKLAPAERVRDTRSFVVRPMPTLAPLTPVSRPVFGGFAPARKPGETAHGRAFWSPFAPPSQPAAVVRASTPFVTARIIPFPSPSRPAMPVEELPQDQSALQAVTEELQALLSDVPVPAPPDDEVVDPEIILDSWSAADVDPDAEPTAERLPDEASPDVVEAAVEDALITESASPELAPAAEMSDLPEETLPPATVTTAADGQADPPPQVADLAGLPLELEAQLADAIGVSLTLDTVTDAPTVVESPMVAKASPAIALAAYDIAADGGDPDVPPELTHTILLIADLPPELQAPSSAVELPLEIAVDEVPGEPAAEEEPLELDGEFTEPEVIVAVADEAVSTPQVAEPPSDPTLSPSVAAELPPTADLADEDEKRLKADAEAEAEAAAMLAIEGRSSPRYSAHRAPPRVVAVEAASSEPAMTTNDAAAAVQASAAAVAAAARAAAAIIAENAADRPAGLSAPRHGQPDDLTHVIGILPVIEQALNRIGVFHFDQIAGWTPANIAWVEAHLGLEGRVGRELWRLQAQELASLSARRELGT